MPYRTTNEEGLVVAGPAIASEHIGGEDTADHVSKMRHIVYVGQGAGDEDIALPRHGKHGF